MKGILNYLFSGSFMGVLLLVFAFSIGLATFIENDFGSDAAKVLVYNARWFEVLLFVMVVNFTGMIFTHKLYRKSKLVVLTIHLSLIIILIGAAITRFFGFEGQMHIRNGQTTDQFISVDTYVYGEISADGNKETFFDKVLFAPIRNNKYRRKLAVGDKDIELKLLHFMPNAKKVVNPSEDGYPVISLVLADKSGRRDLTLKENETTAFGGMTLLFGDTAFNKALQFVIIRDSLFFRSPDEIQKVRMNSGQVTTLLPNEFHPAEIMRIYRVNQLNFIIKDFAKKAIVGYQPSNTTSGSGGVNVLEMRATVDGKDQNFYLKGGKGYPGSVNMFDFNGVHFDLSYGSKTMTLPFALKLNEFQLERYPGSDSPSSYASEVTVIDKEKNVEMPFRIYMNHILDYRGYRFYQSSYDQDEKGTILSVNHDYWGTLITYIGYFLLFASLIASLFFRQSRFVRLSNQLKEIHLKRKKLAIIWLGLIGFTVLPALLSAQEKQPETVPPEPAENFGKLLVQKHDGRIIPINTIANEVLVKVYKKSRFEDYSADQVFLGMLYNPFRWQTKKMIKVGNPDLQNLLHLDGKYAAFNDFFDKSGKYVLKERIDEAFRKSPGQRNKFEKELITVDERVNVCYMTYFGSLLKIYPLPGHPEQKWVTPFDRFEDIPAGDSLFIRKSLKTYMDLLKEAPESGSFAKADAALQEIKDFQYLYGAEVIPPRARLNLEVLYNKLGIFKRLFPVYMMLGIVLLVIFLIELFRPKTEFKKTTAGIAILLFIAFLAHTAGLVMRWYISGHAPWSNGYESMIYIAWASMLAGFLFRKNSTITLSVTAILAGIALLVAHLSWMDPEITNLVPVLKSYWLTIHVATITASYGFLALGSLMAFLNLGIMIFRTKKNIQRIDLTILELTNIIEMSLLVGLVLLTIGNFLGGIWANESWGRYWGWDPKETWSLVTIIIYAFVLHLRLIPGLRSVYAFNFTAMVAFSSVIMTYFGVNYYLSGLHSYAKGDPVPIPDFVYYTVFVVIVISLLAVYNEMKLKGEEQTLKDP